MKRNTVSPRAVRALKRAKRHLKPVFSVMPYNTMPLELWKMILKMGTPNLMFGLVCTCKTWLRYMKEDVGFKCTLSYSQAVHGSDMNWNYMSWLAKYQPSGMYAMQIPPKWMEKRGMKNPSDALKTGLYQYGNDEDFNKARLHLHRPGYWIEIAWVAQANRLDRVKILAEAYFEIAAHGHFRASDAIGSVLKAFSKHNNIPAIEWLMDHPRLRKGVLQSIKVAFNHAPVEMWKYLHEEIKHLPEKRTRMYKKDYLNSSILSGDMESARFAYATFKVPFPNWNVFGIAVDNDDVAMAAAILSNIPKESSGVLRTMWNTVDHRKNILSSEMMDFLMEVADIIPKTISEAVGELSWLREWTAKYATVELMGKIAKKPYGGFLKTEEFICTLLERRELRYSDDNGQAIQFFLENIPNPLSTEIRNNISEVMADLPNDHPSRIWFSKSPWNNMAEDLCFTFDADGTVRFELNNLIRM